MKRRILVSVSAWLAGAVVATSGTLVAISWIGQGISTSSVHTLSVDEVTSALAGMSPSPGDLTNGASGGSAADGASGSASASPSPSASATPSVSRSQSPTAAATTSPPRTLTSPGGFVIAVCTSAGAFLTSWSPAQNYQVGDVRRGPARVAHVEFKLGLTDVEVSVFCHNGVPTQFSPGTGSQSPDE